MENPIFETALLGFSVKVYPKQIVYKKSPVAGETFISMSDVVSVTPSMIGMQRVTVRTSDGKKHKLLVRLKDKKALREAIINSKTSNQ